MCRGMELFLPFSRSQNPSITLTGMVHRLILGEILIVLKRIFRCFMSNGWFCHICRIGLRKIEGGMKCMKEERGNSILIEFTL